jgi:hypothetical protein
MTWIPEQRWMPIAQYRNIPLPIRPLPLMPKRINLRNILKGLKPQLQSKVDGFNISKTIQ